MKRVLLEPAFVLHRRSYRESSALLELFTKEYGLISVVAKSIRRARAYQAGLLQPFIPLLVSFAGKGDLMNLIEVESRSNSFNLKGDCLFAGFYLNELIFNSLQRWDAHPRLFNAYENT